MNALDVITVFLSVVGALFFLAGTVGLWRFPDTCTRLHAITKADNLGLGFVILALLLQTDSWAAGGTMILIWLLTLLASTNGCFLLGRWALRHREHQKEDEP